MASLFCIASRPYSYRSSNYCDNNSCRSFTLLKALAKSNCNLFAIAFKSEKERRQLVGRESDNFRVERELSKKKQTTDTKKMQRGVRVITLQGAIEKSPKFE